MTLYDFIKVANYVKNGGTFMTREEFENELTKRLEDIRALYKKYNPDAFNSGTAHLSCWVDDTSVNAFNNDKNRPVDIYQILR